MNVFERSFGEQARLSREESHHLVRVLRARVGDAVNVLNGEGAVGVGRLIDASIPAIIRIEERKQYTRPEPQITLGICIPKGKTFDSLLKKITEIGLFDVCPLLSERTEVKLDAETSAKKAEHWEQTCIEACKQSSNPFLPKIQKPSTLQSFLEACDADLKIVASLEPASQPLLATLRPSKRVAMLVGPEGDFSPAEYSQIRTCGFLATSLGRNVLRVETAVVYALSVIHAASLR
ncbi:MAG: hypothetical protein A2Y14_05525 [Verrucomicrobia bacterium GWF2_51_19]|nr:MAG: hypothetical protein A2Y14_05525 [Verrucomicrobia bacterium GWF2_51_19]HCJ11636.1 16S rRNA methyltransferase [Opitutae bacterium]